MNWLDLVFILIWIIFLAVGARLGSLWTGGCLLGGFLGALLADYYGIPLSEMIGGFPGSFWAASILIYLGGIAAVLIPAWFLSRISSALFLGLIDSAAGLLTGAFTGVVAIGLSLILIVPVFPKVEKSKAWRKSLVARNFHSSLEDLFTQKNFLRNSFEINLKKEAKKRVKPLTKGAKKKIKKVSQDLIDNLGE